MSLPTAFTEEFYEKSPTYVSPDFLYGALWGVGGVFVGRTHDLAEITTEDSLSINTYYLAAPHEGDNKPCMWLTTGLTASQIQPIMYAFDDDYIYFICGKSSSNDIWVFKFANKSGGMVYSDFKGFARIYGDGSYTPTYYTVLTAEVDATSHKLVIWLRKSISGGGHYYWVINTDFSVDSTTNYAPDYVATNGPFLYTGVVTYSGSSWVTSWHLKGIIEDGSTCTVSIQWKKPGSPPNMFGESDSPWTPDGEEEVYSGTSIDSGTSGWDIANHITPSADYDFTDPDNYYSSYTSGWAWALRLKVTYKSVTYYGPIYGYINHAFDLAELPSFSFSYQLPLYTGHVIDAASIRSGIICGDLIYFATASVQTYNNDPSTSDPTAYWSIVHWDKVDASGGDMDVEYQSDGNTASNKQGACVNGKVYFHLNSTVTADKPKPIIYTNAGGTWQHYNIKKVGGTDNFVGYAADWDYFTTHIYAHGTTPIFVARVLGKGGYYYGNDVFMCELGASASSNPTLINHDAPYTGAPGYYVCYICLERMSPSPDLSHWWAKKYVETLPDRIVEFPGIPPMEPTHWNFPWEGKFRLCKVP